MKLVKAKEIIDLNIKEVGKKMPPDVKASLQLASEALDRILKHRSQFASYAEVPLPGETED